MVFNLWFASRPPPRLLDYACYLAICLDVVSLTPPWLKPGWEVRKFYSLVGDGELFRRAVRYWGLELDERVKPLLAACDRELDPTDNFRLPR